MATQDTNPTDNIFSGLKVVDFASFVAGPGGWFCRLATRLSFRLSSEMGGMFLLGYDEEAGRMIEHHGVSWKDVAWADANWDGVSWKGGGWMSDSWQGSTSWNGAADPTTWTGVSLDTLLGGIDTTAGGH